MKTLKCLVLTDKSFKRNQLEQHIHSTEALELVSGDSSASYHEMSQVRDEEVDLIFLDSHYIQPIVQKFENAEDKPYLIALDQSGQAFSSGQQRYKSLTSLSYESFLKTILDLWTQGINPNGLTRQKYIFIKSEYKLIKAPFDSILFCEGMKDYSKIFLQGKSFPLVTLQNLKNLSSRLPSQQFIRVHRSFVISINHIDEISRSEISIGNTKIPIGKNFRESLQKLIQENSWANWLEKYHPLLIMLSFSHRIWARIGSNSPFETVGLLLRFIFSTTILATRNAWVSLENPRVPGPPGRFAWWM
jgi:hypothetical protein